MVSADARAAVVRRDIDDLLTRTTLQIAGALSKQSIDQLSAALRRVPGVLLADVSTTGAYASAAVAHDSAVQMTSLLGATEQAGFRATVVSPVPSTSVDGIRAQRAPFRERLIVFAICFVALTLGNVLVRMAPREAWLFPLLFIGVWVFYISSMNRRV